MALDPSIILQAKQVQFENPLNQLAKIAQLQGAQSQNRLADLKFSEAEREVNENKLLGDAYKNALGADGKFDRNKLYSGLAQGGLGSKLPTVQKGFADQDKATADLDKVKLDGITKRLEIAGQAFGYVRNNPSLEAANSVLDYLGQNGVYSPEQVAQYKSAVTANPAAIKQLADQAFQSVLSAKEQLPKFETRNTGGSTDTLEINPVTGTTKTINSVRNTQSPDSVASTGVQIRGQNLTDARGRESNALSRERLNFDKTQPKGQVVQTDQGPMIVDTRVGTGKQITGPDGNPVGPKLKDLPAPIAKAHMENQASLRKIDQALAAIDAYPDALGGKNYLGDAIRQRSDPKGVEARALVADVGSLKVHDRSGAAVTAAEMPRLQPFIPTATDSPATAKRKLALFKQEYEAINNDIAATYGKDQGYKAPTATAPAKAGPASAAPKPGAVMDGYRFKGGNPADQSAWEKM